VGSPDDPGRFPGFLWSPFAASSFFWRHVESPAQIDSARGSPEILGEDLIARKPPPMAPWKLGKFGPSRKGSGLPSTPLPTSAMPSRSGANIPWGFGALRGPAGGGIFDRNTAAPPIARIKPGPTAPARRIFNASFSEGRRRHEEAPRRALCLDQPVPPANLRRASRTPRGATRQRPRRHLVFRRVASRLVRVCSTQMLLKQPARKADRPTSGVFLIFSFGAVNWLLPRRGVRRNHIGQSQRRSRSP